MIDYGNNILVPTIPPSISYTDVPIQTTVPSIDQNLYVCLNNTDQLYTYNNQIITIVPTSSIKWRIPGGTIHDQYSSDLINFTWKIKLFSDGTINVFYFGDGLTNY